MRWRGVRPSDLPFQPQPATSELDPVRISARAKIEIASVHRVPQEHGLPDSTEKFVTLDHNQRVNGFLLLSARIAPKMVHRSVERAAVIKGRLPKHLGAAVLTPVDTGTVNRRTYALYPIRRPPAEGRFARRWQQLRFGGRILDWLDDAVAASAIPVTDQAKLRDYAALLRNFEADSRFPEDMRRAASRAVSAINSADWVPRVTVMHNDFWWGNVVFADPQRSGGLGFQFIDWAGAEDQGYPVFDLVRMAKSLRLRNNALRRHLSNHAQALDCDIRCCEYYLLGALANLGCKLEYFPEERYISMCQEVWRQFIDVLD